MGWSHATLAVGAAILLISCSPRRDKRPRHPTILGGVVGAGDVTISRPTGAVACDAAEVVLMDGETVEKMVVAGRVYVIPLKDDRIAIRAIGYGRSGTTTVNEFVLRTNGEVEKVPEGLSPVMDRAIRSPLRCKLHGVPLVDGQEMMKQTNWTTPDGYDEMQKERFPNAMPNRISGSLPEEMAKAVIRKVSVRYCPKCREAEKTWLGQHGINEE